MDPQTRCAARLRAIAISGGKVSVISPKDKETLADNEATWVLDLYNRTSRRAPE